METIEFNKNLPQKEKDRRLREAKIGDVYPGWTPYCCCCKKSPRMIQQDFGFSCPNCGNLIGWNLNRLIESPINDKSYYEFIKSKLEPYIKPEE